MKKKCDAHEEICYGFVNSRVTPHGLVDPNGTFYSTQRADLNEKMRYRMASIWMTPITEGILASAIVSSGIFGICLPHVVKILLFTRMIST